MLGKYDDILRVKRKQDRSQGPKIKPNVVPELTDAGRAALEREKIRRSAQDPATRADLEEQLRKTTAKFEAWKHKNRLRYR